MNTPDRQTNPPEPGPCFKCDDEKWITCPECQGRGYTIWDLQTGIRKDCPKCQGDGEIECPYCK